MHLFTHQVLSREWPSDIKKRYTIHYLKGSGFVLAKFDMLGLTSKFDGTLVKEKLASSKQADITCYF